MENYGSERLTLADTGAAGGMSSYPKIIKISLLEIAGVVA